MMRSRPEAERIPRIFQSAAGVAALRRKLTRTKVGELKWHENAGQDGDRDGWRERIGLATPALRGGVSPRPACDVDAARCDSVAAEMVGELRTRLSW